MTSTPVVPRLLARATVAAAVLSAGLTWATAPAAAATAELQLQPDPDKVVTVDNLSGTSDARIHELVRLADRGMATIDPGGVTTASGEMQTGDRVVVTDAAIYWLDVRDRGGLLSGAWPLARDGAGVTQFAYRPNGSAWSPNSFLPASTGRLDRPFDGGQTINVLPMGGHDGSCEPGKGTWMIGNTANCGVARPGVPVTIRRTVSGSAHRYEVSGTMYQAGTTNLDLVDDQGRRAQMRFTLAYTFRDRTNNVSDYGKWAGTQQRRVRAEISLTPTAPIDLGTVVVAGNADLLDSSRTYPLRSVNLSNTTRGHWRPASCGPWYSISAGLTAGLCQAPAVNWITQGNALPATLRAGDWVTQRQVNSIKSGTDRAMTLLVPSVTGARLPERIDHIWNAGPEGLGVTAFDVDYFNNERVTLAGGQRMLLAFDLQLEPVVK